VRPVFVDCHSHVCPSGDDGVATVAEGAVLCREAAKRGTGILYATPHVWPHLPLTPAREEQVRRDFAELVPQAGLDGRLGLELTPTRPLLDDERRGYALDDRQRRVLIERYGLDGSEPKTLEEIGRNLGLTRERVRQIEVESLKRLAALHEMAPVAPQK